MSSAGAGRAGEVSFGVHPGRAWDVAHQVCVLAAAIDEPVLHNIHNYEYYAVVPKIATLAFSGGLDTSCAIAWLKEDYGFDEVVAVLVDVGQQTDFEPAFERGYAAGASEVMLVDRKDDFADEQVAKAIQANALYEGKYPL